MRRTAGARSVLGTALAGALVGFALAAFGGTFVAGLVAGAHPAEPPVARTFISALLRQDVDTIGRLKPPEGVVTAAKRVQSRLNATTWTPAAVSYLGGGEQGGIGVYIYVAKIRSPDGSQAQVAPFAVTIQSGKVVRVQ